MENIIEEYTPTTQEVINQKLSRMLELDSFLMSKDYLTYKSVDGNDMSLYGDYSGKRDTWRAEYNNLEAEVEQLKIQIKNEQTEPAV